MQGYQKEASTRKGVRQGCSLSPSLLNLYSEEAINKIKNIDVKVHGGTIKILRFADDTSLLANTERELEEALNERETVFNNYIGLATKSFRFFSARWL